MARTNNPSRRHVIDRLYHSEERFRLLVESVQDYALYMLDPAGRVASWNQGAERMTGYRSDEILGRHFSQFYAREDTDAGKPDAALETASTVGRFEDEGWRVRKDGSRFWAGVVITAIRDESGTLRGFGKVTRDLTERTQTAQRLEESQARLEGFMNHSPSVMFIKSLEGRYQYVNDQFCSSFGLERDTVLERTDAEIFSADQAARFKANDASVIAAGTALEFEETAEYRNGRHISIACKFPIRDVHGRVTALGGVVTDITERKRIEQELLHMCERAMTPNRSAHVDNTDESKSTQRDDKNTDSELVDEFALMISRDLGPPLRNIEALAVEVRDEMAELNAMATHLDRIAHSAAGLTKLTKDLLMFSHSSQRYRSDCRAADLELIVASACFELGVAARSPAIHWKIGKLPQVAGDPALLRVVFENVLSNAIKFSRQRNPAVIEVTASAGSGDEIVVEIKDNGVGFSEQHAHRLFRAFQHLHGDSQYEGIGIGLATAKRIIERHGGRIWAKSRPDEGASFYFTLLRPAVPPGKIPEDTNCHVN
jgi:PAS domain S-box-containing protein